jgi:hypothetical protein
MNKTFSLIIFLMGTLVGTSSLYASPLTAPVEAVALPSSKWVFQPPEQKDGTQKIMYPKETGQAVNVRVHTYDVPVSAKAFIEQVRANIIQKPDYQGAEVRLLESRQVNGESWDVFSIRRTDEINQEIWARKTSTNVVLMIIYTGAGDYYKQYHDDLMTVIKKAS